MKYFIHRSGLVLLLILMLFGSAPIQAETAAEAPAAVESEGADDSTTPDTEDAPSTATPANVVNEVVVVEGSLPYIPTTNMIATRLPIALRWTPTNVGTVNEPVLNEQLARVLSEALNNISGVNSQTQSGVADFFTVRGFDSLSGAMVLTDGAPEPEVSVYQMYNVERVEVMKGPGGFLYGRNGLSGALAGIVNIVRRQPEPISFGNVGVSYGSFNTGQIDLDTNIAPENSDIFSSRINAMYRESDFYRDDKQNETAAINPSFAWRIDADTTMNLSLEYAELKFSPDSGIPLLNNTLPDVDRKTSYQSPVDFSDQSVGRFQFDVQTALNSSWSLRNKTYYRNLDWRTDGTIFTGYANALNPICMPSPGATGPEVCRALTQLDDEQTFAGNQFEVVWDGQGGSVGYNLLMGIELGSYADQFTLDVSAIPSIPLFNPVESPGPVFPIAPQQVGDSRSLVAAPYVINNFDFTDRFKMLVGARFDYIDYEDTATSESRSDNDISPMLGLTFGASDAVNIYASASEAFGPPSGRVAGEPVPEESRQFEIGTKLGRDGGKVQTTIAFYHLERENIGIVDATGFAQQAGDQRSRGAEIEFAAQPRPRLRTFVSYAYNNAELTSFSQCIFGADLTTGQCNPNPFGGSPVADRSGNTPAFAPEHLVNAWVSQRFGNGWGVGGGVRYVSEQFIAEDNVASIDAYFLLDGAIYYTIGQWDMSLNFRNITDEKYEIRGFGAGSVIPANPFSVFAGLDYRF